MKFSQAVDHILKYEGGYVWDKADPGGETHHGISKRAHPDLDILNLTKSQAKDIYRNHYWDRLLLDKFPPFIRLILFDTCVVQGHLFAITTLQKLIQVHVDGLIGPVTLNMVQSVNQERLVRNYTVARIKRFISLKHFSHFGDGWLKRAVDCVVKSSITVEI